MAKKNIKENIEETPTQTTTAEPTTTQEVGETGTQTSEEIDIPEDENPHESGANATEPENPNVDKKGKAKATAKERIAAKLLEKLAIDVVYITSDDQCFDNLQNAENHAARLDDNEIVTIKK